MKKCGANVSFAQKDMNMNAKRSTNNYTKELKLLARVESRSTNNSNGMAWNREPGYKDAGHDTGAKAKQKMKHRTTNNERLRLVGN